MVKSGALVWRTNKNPNTTSRDLVDRPIQIVEYERYTWTCSVCAETERAHWSPEIVPGQDIGITGQAFLGWINN